MPDRWGFDHLPLWGATQHRCIECGFPEQLRTVPDKEREKHFLMHQREREREVKKRQRENAATARRMKRMKRKES